MKHRMLLINSIAFLSLMLFGVSSRAHEGDNDIQVNDESTDTYSQAETTIVVNPADPLNIIGGAIERTDGIIGGPIEGNDAIMRCAYYTSTDGGKTWPVSGSVSEHCWDPDLAVDAQGNIYYAFLSKNSEDITSLFVSQSTDHGATFNDPVLVKTASDECSVDKGLLTADVTRGPYSGYLYLAWTECGISFSRSIDGGKNWAVSQIISEPNQGGQGQNPAVGPDGEVYVVWWHITDPLKENNDDDRIYIDKSTDGGVTFGTDILVADVESDHYDLIGGLQPGYGFILPSIDVDRTDSPYRGNIYITWDDVRNGDSDIYFTRSIDGGKTWDEVSRINDDAVGNGKDQFLAALTVAPTGRLHVVFIDRREDPKNQLFSLFYTYSEDGGETFSKNIKVADHPFDSMDAANHWIGEYIQVAASSSSVLPLFPVAQSGDADIFTALTIGIDTDGDDVEDDVDNCPGDYNPVKEDEDGDNVGNVCDNCPQNSNPPSGSNHYQDDRDFDTIGDACDCAPDNPKEPGQDGECRGCGALSFLLPGSPYGFFGGIMFFMALIVGVRWRMRYKV